MQSVTYHAIILNPSTLLDTRSLSARDSAAPSRSGPVAIQYTRSRGPANLDSMARSARSVTSTPPHSSAPCWLTSIEHLYLYFSFSTSSSRFLRKRFFFLYNSHIAAQHIRNSMAKRYAVYTAWPGTDQHSKSISVSVQRHAPFLSRVEFHACRLSSVWWKR
eukprot:6184704-Pleurochrysis_carterae.AAC.3